MPDLMNISQMFNRIPTYVLHAVAYFIPATVSLNVHIRQNTKNKHMSIECQKCINKRMSKFRDRPSHGNFEAGIRLFVVLTLLDCSVRCNIVQLNLIGKGLKQS